MDPFRNLTLNLRASGTAAIVCMWLICVTLIALFGTTHLAERAMTLFAVAGGVILVGITVRS